MPCEVWRAHAQRHPLGAHVHACGPRGGLRQGRARGVEKRARARIEAGRGARGGDGQGERQARLAGDAFLLAHQPGDIGVEADGSAGSERGGRHDAREQGRLALVAEIHQVRDGDAAGRRPGDGIGGKAGRQLPGNGDGFAEVAGIAPVDVPALLDAQADADPERLAWSDGGRLGDQLGLHQLAHRRRSLRHALPAGESQHEEEGATSAPQAHRQIASGWKVRAARYWGCWVGRGLSTSQACSQFGESGPSGLSGSGPSGAARRAWGRGGRPRRRGSPAAPGRRRRSGRRSAAPTGRPPAVNPHGMEAAGCCVRLKG